MSMNDIDPSKKKEHQSVASSRRGSFYQIPLHFEELRQSIQNVNLVLDQREQSQKIRSRALSKMSHITSDNRNKEISITSLQNQKKEEQPSKKQDDIIIEDPQIENLKQEIMKRDEHKIELATLVIRLNTDLKKGLSSGQAEEFNKEQGDNKLSEKQKVPLWKKLLKELTNPFIILLIMAFILCLITYILEPEDLSNLYLGIVLIIVVFATTLITFQQNQKSEALMNSFKNFFPSKCIVIRDEQEMSIDTEKLVRGDIVIIKAGEKIPADMRMIYVNEMKVDNSSLTGESDLQIRTTNCTHPNSLLETQNIAFFGTLCKEGLGVGVVIKIGDQTTIGEIADLASKEKERKSTLRIEMDRLVVIMVIFSLSLGILFFFLSYFVLGYSLMKCSIFGIGIIVANIPEGLLGCITVSLAITAQALHKKNVLVKNLEAVETLGSTSCICTDKTGTLTQNVMTVENLWLNGSISKAVNKLKIEDTSVLQYKVESFSFKELLLSAILSSDAKFDKSQVKDQESIDYLTCPVVGDATETGLIRFFQPIEDITLIRQQYNIPFNDDKVNARMPFNSTEKFALTIVECKTEDSDYCIYIKGAPEKIWSFCTSIQIEDNAEYKIHHQDQFRSANKFFGKNGQRVLGFAKYNLPRSQFPLNNFSFISSNPKNFNFPIDQCTFLGLISLIDPPKTRVPEAIKECRSAGVKIIMITGDQPSTASSIAKQVHIIPNNVKTIDEIMEEDNISWEEAVDKCQAIVVHGEKIVEYLEKEEEEKIEKFTNLRKWINKPYCVFARTTPAQKLQIVQACQMEGFVCAVTGDGVNDSPAIKQGDIGVSMNLTGSDVTKDAADMILLDDDFASIVSGIEEGRKIFDNLKKSFIYLLCSNIPEIMPFIAFIVFRIPLPLTNLFMLSICVGTDTYPSISLAHEESEIDLMTRRPRSKKEHLVSLKLMTHSYGLIGFFSMFGGFLAYFTSMNYYGFPPLELIGLTSQEAFKPPLKDFSETQNHQYKRIFNANIMKNSNCTLDMAIINEDKKKYSWKVDWDKVSDGEYDLRKAFVKCNEESGQWEQKVQWSNCNIEKNISDFVKNTACYSTEGLKFAQSSFFIGIVVFQWSNLFACKARKVTFTTTSVNYVMIRAIIFETMLATILLFVPGINSFIGGRPLQFFQFGVSAFPFSIFVLGWEETRKFLIRFHRFFLKYCLW